MTGLSCGSCSHGNKPYISAYDIAQKHGYQGTEEDWVKTLQCIFLAKVTGCNGVDWTCDTTFEELIDRASNQEVHLLTLEGRTAFCHGFDEHVIKFQTLPYQDDDLGHVYEEYEMYVSGVTFVTYRDATSPGQNSITKPMLATSVQNSLDKADTAYQKPAGGIPYSDLKADLVSDINKAPIIYIRLVDSGIGVAVDLEHTDFHGYTSPQEAIADGADVRIAHTDTRLTGSPYITHPFIGALNGALAFGGLELYLDDGYAFGFGWYIITEAGGTISVEKYYDTSMDLFVADEPQLEP